MKYLLTKIIYDFQDCAKACFYFEFRLDTWGLFGERGVGEGRC